VSHSEADEASDELAERRIARDFERERGPRRRGGAPGRTQMAFRAAELTIDTSITAVSCPACSAPCFAPSDSDRERIDCASCDARLITRQSIGGLELAPTTTKETP
jgi:hypothetical protein